MPDHFDQVDDREDVRQLLANVRASLPQLEGLLERCSSHWGYEDPVYRFYHQSFKIYHLQRTTKEIVRTLEALAPGRALNAWFLRIVEDGTSETFDGEVNQHWEESTRPIVEAFFHARFFLEMAVRYGQELANRLAFYRAGGPRCSIFTASDETLLALPSTSALQRRAP